MPYLWASYRWTSDFILGSIEYKIFMPTLDWRRAPMAAVVILIILMGAVNVYYFHVSKRPTFWDDSSYLTGSLDLYDALTGKGVPGMVNAFSHLYGNKAPLICVFPIPIYLLFGRDYDPRCLVGVGFLILMSIYIFRLGTCLWSPAEGLLAVAIAQTMPLLYGLTRQFLVDYGLAAMVVMWMFYLLCSGGFTTRAILRLGALLGIGILMKITFPLYVGVPTLLMAGLFIWRERVWRFALRTILALCSILAIGGAIASIWYIANLKTILGFALSAGYGKLSVNYGNTSVFSWPVISTYWALLVVCALSCWYAVLFLGLLPFWIKSLWSKGANNIGTGAVIFLWVLVPFAATTLGVNKDPRYTAPFLPALALFLAYLIRSVFGRTRFFPIIAGALMIVPTIAYASASLPALEHMGDFKIGRWVFWSPHLAWYASVPASEGGWDQQQILNMVCSDAQTRPNGARVLIPIAHQYLNNANMAYYATRLKCNVQVIGIPQELKAGPQFEDWFKAVKPVYVLAIPDVPQPDLAPPFANNAKEEAERMVSRRDSGFSLMYRGSLGATGKEYLIYRRL